MNPGGSAGPDAPIAIDTCPALVTLSKTSVTGFWPTIGSNGSARTVVPTGTSGGSALHEVVAQRVRVASDEVRSERRERHLAAVPGQQAARALRRQTGGTRPVAERAVGGRRDQHRLAGRAIVDVQVVRPRRGRGAGEVGCRRREGDAPPVAADRLQDRCCDCGGPVGSHADAGNRAVPEVEHKSVAVCCVARNQIVDRRVERDDGAAR